MGRPDVRASLGKALARSLKRLGLPAVDLSAAHRPPGLRGRRFTVEAFRRMAPLLDRLGEIAAARGRSRAQIAINWCLATGTLPIPGAKTGAQARENAGALGWALTPEEMAVLDAAAEEAVFS